MSGRAKRTLAMRIAVDLLLAGVFLYSSVNRFSAPRFALPNYIYVGSAIFGLLIAVVFIVDSVRSPGGCGLRRAKFEGGGVPSRGCLDWRIWASTFKGTDLCPYIKCRKMCLGVETPASFLLRFFHDLFSP